jgi:DHA2 family multidrug resistance protein
MLATGVAQLAMAPIAVALERRANLQLLSALGCAVFAYGSWLSASQTGDTDYSQMLVPQLLRGSAIMFCLLPPTRLALGRLSPERVTEGSGLFNMMRNLGGAVGLALIDTVIFSRAPKHADTIVDQLKACNVETAKALGIARELFVSQCGQPVPPMVEAMLRPSIERLAMVRAINDAWALVAGLTLAALLLIPFIRPMRRASRLDSPAAA